MPNRDVRIDATDAGRPRSLAEWAAIPAGAGRRVEVPGDTTALLRFTQGAGTQSYPFYADLWMGETWRVTIGADGTVSDDRKP